MTNIFYINFENFFDEMKTRKKKYIIPVTSFAEAEK